MPHGPDRQIRPVNGRELRPDLARQHHRRACIVPLAHHHARHGRDNRLIRRKVAVRPRLPKRSDGNRHKPRIQRRKPRIIEPKRCQLPGRRGFHKNVRPLQQLLQRLPAPRFGNIQHDAPPIQIRIQERNPPLHIRDVTRERRMHPIRIPPGRLHLDNIRPKPSQIPRAISRRHLPNLHNPQMPQRHHRIAVTHNRSPHSSGARSSDISLHPLIPASSPSFPRKRESRTPSPLDSSVSPTKARAKIPSPLRGGGLGWGANPPKTASTIGVPPQTGQEQPGARILWMNAK